MESWNTPGKEPMRKRFRERTQAGIMCYGQDIVDKFQYRPMPQFPWHKHFHVLPFRFRSEMHYTAKGWRLIGGMHVRQICPFGFRFSMNMLQKRPDILWAMFSTRESKGKYYRFFWMDSQPLYDSFVEWCATVWMLAIERFPFIYAGSKIQEWAYKYFMVREDGNLDVKDDYFREYKPNEVPPWLGHGRGSAPSDSERKRLAILPDSEPERNAFSTEGIDIGESAATDVEATGETRKPRSNGKVARHERDSGRRDANETPHGRRRSHKRSTRDVEGGACVAGPGSPDPGVAQGADANGAGDDNGTSG